jgi:hypothetical protein
MALNPATLFKFLGVDGRPVYGGTGTWELPENGAPGAWMPEVVGDLSLYSVGYHLLRRSDLVYWVAEKLYVAEYRGDIVPGAYCVVCSEARLVSEVTTWNTSTSHMFAADCAERVLSLYTDIYPGDARPEAAIAASRAFAAQSISSVQLFQAKSNAWLAAVNAEYENSAAAAAARAAAYCATWDNSIAVSKTCSAVMDAAWSIWNDEIALPSRLSRDAHVVARDMEYSWQINRLWQYLTGSIGA